MDPSQCDKRGGCRQLRLQLHLNLNPNLKVQLLTPLKIQRTPKLPRILKARHQAQRMLTPSITHRQPLHNDLKIPTSLEGSTQIIPGPRVISNPMGSQVLRCKSESDPLMESPNVVLNMIIRLSTP